MSEEFEYLGKGPSPFMRMIINGRENFDLADYYHCHKCNNYFWFSPPSQTCLRKERKCPYCYTFIEETKCQKLKKYAKGIIKNVRKLSCFYRKIRK